MCGTFSNQNYSATNNSIKTFKFNNCNEWIINFAIVLYLSWFHSKFILVNKIRDVKNILCTIEILQIFWFKTSKIVRSSFYLVI